MIEIRNLSMTYRTAHGEHQAVKDVSLDIRQGQFYTLLGPSGCGKTTLLRCIAGLERPDSGHIYIGEQMVDPFTPGQRDIAMVFQTVSLFPHMTVAENISFPLKVRGSSVQAMGDKVREVAKLL